MPEKSEKSQNDYKWVLVFWQALFSSRHLFPKSPLDWGLNWQAPGRHLPLLIWGLNQQAPNRNSRHLKKNSRHSIYK